MSRLLLITAITLGSAIQSAAQDDLSRPILYKLDRDSTMERGCFPPCLCPVLESAPLRGTFRLVPTGNNGLFDLYDVLDVRWKTSLGGQDVAITGSGTYAIGGEFALEHHLTLDLALGSDPPEHFDSGGRLVPPTPFPRIDISVSIHGEFCFDTVIDLHARPARRLHVDRDSAWWEPEPEPVLYDVMRGSLGALRTTGGAFDQATEACLADNTDLQSVTLIGDPPPEGGFWFLVCVEGDTCDSGDPTQVASRDPGIRASPLCCP